MTQTVKIKPSWVRADNVKAVTNKGVVPVSLNCQGSETKIKPGATRTFSPPQQVFLQTPAGYNADVLLDVED